MPKTQFTNSEDLFYYLYKNNITNFKSFEFTFEYFNQVIGKYIIKQYLDNLPSNLHNDQVFLSKLICNDAGFVMDKDKIICYCNIGFFLDYCQKSGKYYWKNSWKFYYILFSIIYVITLLILSYKLIKIVNTKESFCNKLLRLITTPKCLVILNLEIFSLVRTIYMIIDPYGLKKIFNKPVERILSGILLSGIVSIYLILLLMWIGLNHVFDFSKSILQRKVSQYFYNQKKYTIVIILILIYPYQICVSYFTNSLKNININFVRIYSSLLYFVFFISYIWSLRTMFMIREKLNNIYLNSNKNKEISYKKIILNNNDLKDESEELSENLNSTRNFLNKTNLKFKNNNLSNDKKYISYNFNYEKKNNNDLNEQQNINFLELSFKNNYIDEVDKCLKNKNDDENSKEFDLDYEKEIMKLDIYNLKNDTYFDDNYKTKTNLYLRKNTLKFTYYDEEKNYTQIQDDFLLTKEDNANISNIFLMSFLFMIVTTVLSIYYFLISIDLINNTPWLLYYFIFANSCLEILYIITVYFVFYKNKLSIEYKNLQYIGEIEKYYEKKNNYIFFDEIKYTKIYRRLKEIFKFLE